MVNVPERRQSIALHRSFPVSSRQLGPFRRRRTASFGRRTCRKKGRETRVSGRAYAKRLAGLGAKVAVADLNLRSYEEFEAKAKDMTADRSRMQEAVVLGPWSRPAPARNSQSFASCSWAMSSVKDEARSMTPGPSRG